MMNNNKILTVSYGTFSCTLEGFDDSFGTMKAIAEYFRDLASEDRYFGAEPPQPDAEVLAHIAQREISRRVEAREQDGKIVLSAVEEKTAPPTASPQITSVASAGASVVSTSFAPRRPNEISQYYDAYRMNALKVLEPGAQEAVPEVQAPKAQTPEQVQPDIAAAPEPVLKPEAELKEAESAKAPEAQDEDVVQPPKEAKIDLTPPTGKITLTERDLTAGQPDSEAEAFFAESPTADAAVEEVMDEADAPDVVVEPKRDSIAAKLQRIRSVVSRQDADAVAPDYTEDEHAEESAASVETDGMTQSGDKAAIVADAVQDIEDALGQDDATAASVEDDEDDITALLGRLDADTQEEEAYEPSIAAEDDGIADDDQTPENMFEDKTAEQVSAAPRGRVIKVKRSDLDLAIAKGDLEEYSAEDAVKEGSSDVTDGLENDLIANVEASDASQTPERTGQDVSSLSEEEEDELARELAEVEAALNDSAEDETPKAAAPSLRRKLPSLEADQGSDMNRLLAETDNQMDDPESTTRRSAISHLRAAVAAKKADVALGAPDEKDDDDVYRNDLAEVVKPRRPVSGTARRERPSEGAPAPLKLVPAQRIDADAPAQVAPVRPRRVAQAPIPVAVPPIDGGFAEFAAEMGAVKLPELLEAAAAYMSFVEGLDQFSRPQLMNTVRQVEQEDFSREDGLRSFGQLLRTGKIHKLNGGRFKASEDIGYQPDARAAG